MPPVTQTDNQLVDFLRTFGPVATSDSLCDENVRQAERTYGVQGITTPAARLDDVKQTLLEDGLNVILTGTAGDGKTFHIRQFFMERFPGREAEWPGEAGVLSLELAPGRELRIIRDLSEISDTEKEAELEALSAALLGQSPERLYLVAANDGQLLKYFRDAAQRLDASPTSRRLQQSIATMLREEREDLAGLSLRLFNLSRTWSEKVVDGIFDAVLHHPAWGACDTCPSSSGGNACPIQLNRELLLNAGDGESPFRNRIRQSLRLAAANDQHVPIRQLLVLVVNILLGDARNPDRPLLDCATARKRAAKKEYGCTNPYNNAAGLNLRPERRRANRVFNVFELLGVGYETNNLIDAMLVQGEPKALQAMIFEQEPTYGIDLFTPQRKSYFALGGAETGVVREFRTALETQRRRAFFRLPEKPPLEAASPWRLTIFQHGGEYLDLLDALISKKGKEVVDPFTRQLVRGLNRAFSGMMTNDEDRLWFAGTIGRTDDPSGRVSTISGVDRVTTSGVSVRLTLDPVTCRPTLGIALPKFMSGPPIRSLELRPLLFEYLMRVANGSLPASFSRQCQQEIRHFALSTTSSLRAMFDEEDENGREAVRILGLGSNGEIQPSVIEV